MALSAFSTVAQISANNSTAKAKATESVRRAENQIVGNELRKNDRRRQMQASIEEASAIYGGNGIDTSASNLVNTHVGGITKEFSFDQYMDDFNTSNSTDALNRTAKSYGTDAGNQNAQSLFKIGQSGVDYLGIVKEG